MKSFIVYDNASKNDQVDGVSRELAVRKVSRADDSASNSSAFSAWGHIRKTEYGITQPWYLRLLERRDRFS